MGSVIPFNIGFIKLHILKPPSRLNGNGRKIGVVIKAKIFYFTNVFFVDVPPHTEVRRSLVGRPVFKTGVGVEKTPRWVRFPCTSANYCRLAQLQT
ncbi:MAG: hypothetical protein ACD_55C00108G0002 [uncultured bacterium]|nr:MAG: hypothetical protein ACD_55C00108G0002 [uncultured bacterium]